MSKLTLCVLSSNFVLSLLQRTENTFLLCKYTVRVSVLVCVSFSRDYLYSLRVSAYGAEY